MSPLGWDEVTARLDAAAIWWIATASRTDGPHAVPVWGVVVGAAAFSYAEAGSRRCRDLADDPRAVIHLESGADVCIAHGRLSDVGLASDNRDVCAAYAAKYTGPAEQAFLPDAPQMAGVRLLRFEPHRAFTWDIEDFFGSQRRWSAR